MQGRRSTRSEPLDHLRRDLHNSTYHLPTGRSGLFPPLSGIRFAGLPLGIISLSYRFHIVFITHSPQKAKKIPLVFRCPTTCLCLHNIVFSFALLSLCPWSSFCCWSSVVFLVLVQLPVLFFCAAILFPLLPTKNRATTLLDLPREPSCINSCHAQP